MADDLDKWLGDLPGKLKDQLVSEFADIVDEEMVDPVRAAAPIGATGRLRDSVRKSEGRNDLEWIVEAGGSLTTKDVRVGADADYDYALAVEFGNEHVPAKPFFYPTIRARRARFNERVNDLIGRVLGKL